ncbi:phosphatase PAP2 family protein [Paraburkholderia sp. BCC1884]|uniref:phosphatase PAP2 family protein n=1 Tax=Paraburkholderia sp. BCC1884 TaxID=2562668 RepID=UPI001642EA2A|nr:phosphatase PAP2 family protein [Paraburkholderia sp. BCC1884]
MVGIVLLIDVIWLRVAHYAVSLAGIEGKAKNVGQLILMALGVLIVTRIPRYRQITATLRIVEVSRTVAWYAVLTCFFAVAAVLSYLCVTVNPPLVDGTLVRFDQTLGFDWLALYQWVQAHPHVHRILQLAYESGRWQLPIIPFVLGLSGQNDELSDFVFLVMVSALLVLVLSTPFPATAAFVHFNVADPNLLATVSDFATLRDGTQRTFDLASVQGLVSIPSFHTVLAVLFTYALRRTPLLFWCAVVLNTTMIASTPTQGGHYLADVIAGLALATLTIWCVKRAHRQGAARPHAGLTGATG